MGLPGLNQYYTRINVSCSRTTMQCSVRLEPAASMSRVKHSITEFPIKSVCKVNQQITKVTASKERVNVPCP